MKLQNVKGKKLTSEQLRTISAGVAPDCPDGEVLQYVPGAGWVCGPVICTWEIPADDPV